MIQQKMIKNVKSTISGESIFLLSRNGFLVLKARTDKPRKMQWTSLHWYGALN